MSSDLGMLEDFDRSDDRRVDEEVSFNTDTSGNLSDDEGSPRFYFLKRKKKHGTFF